MRHLARRHALMLAAFLRPDDVEARRQHLRRLCAEVTGVPVQHLRARDLRAAASALLRQQPLIIVRDESRRIGAEGIASTDGHDLLIADDPAGFAAAVIRLLQDRELAHRLAVAGRQTAEVRYNWRTVYSAWDALYGDVGSK